MAEYQAIPALSAGGAWTLSEMCPALYWSQSPFNPSALPSTNKLEFDIGIAAHMAVLEPHEYSERVFHVPFDTYQKAEARQMRDAAYCEGKTPLKPAERKIVDCVRDAILRRPDVARLFTGGEPEVSVVIEDFGGVRAKARADYLPDAGIVDLKTVSCAHPGAVARYAASHGWHLRAAWYSEAFGAKPYLFVCVEKTPPYLVEVYELDERALAWGEQVMRRALRLFKLCRENDHWPGYGRDPVTKLSLPTYTEYALADREQAGEFSE